MCPRTQAGPEFLYVNMALAVTTLGNRVKTASLGPRSSISFLLCVDPFPLGLPSGSAHIPLVRSLASEGTPGCHRGPDVNRSRAVSLATSLSSRDVAREQGFPNYNAQAPAQSAQRTSAAMQGSWHLLVLPEVRAGGAEPRRESWRPQWLSPASGNLSGQTVRLTRREMLADGTDPSSHHGHTERRGRALASECRWVECVLYAPGTSLSPIKVVKSRVLPTFLGRLHGGAPGLLGTDRTSSNGNTVSTSGIILDKVDWHVSHFKGFFFHPFEGL